MNRVKFWQPSTDTVYVATVSQGKHNIWHNPGSKSLRTVSANLYRKGYIRLKDKPRYLHEQRTGAKD
jgi:hypothetical protein